MLHRDYTRYCKSDYLTMRQKIRRQKRMLDRELIRVKMNILRPWVEVSRRSKICLFRVIYQKRHGRRDLKQDEERARCFFMLAKSEFSWRIDTQFKRRRHRIHARTNLNIFVIFGKTGNRELIFVQLNKIFDRLDKNYN